MVDLWHRILTDRALKVAHNASWSSGTGSRDNLMSLLKESLRANRPTQNENQRKRTIHRDANLKN
jgi:hypothetical protein